MKNYLLGILFLIYPQWALTQSMSISSYYPASAFVTNRLLPFTVTGGAGLFVKSVELKSGDDCQAFVDPYHERVFHIYCLRPSLVSANILVSDQAMNNYSLSMGYISIFNESLPGQSTSPVFKSNEAQK